MAGQITNLSDDPTKLPHEVFNLRFGPLNHAAGNGGIAMGTGLTQNDLGYLTDREMVVDTVTVVVKTKPASARGIRLGWATNGQTLSAASSASQFFTSLFDLNTLTNATKASVTVDTANNVIPAGSRLFYQVDDAAGGTSADTALVGLAIMIRGSTRVI